MFSVGADCFSGCLAKVLFEEQRDSRVCCVHCKFFGSDTLLINCVDPSYLNKAFFLACRNVFIPQEEGAGFVSPDYVRTGDSRFLKGMNGNESTSWWRCEKQFVYPHLLRWKGKVTQGFAL